MAGHLPEEKDGIRFAWNVWPNTRIEASRMIVPVSALFTPLMQQPDGALPKVEYGPVVCTGQNCESVLNPNCQIDFLNKIWSCPFCLTRNHFPHHYADISPDNLPAELIADYSTMEYIMPEKPVPPPVFLFVVDTCIIEEELQSVKDALLQSLMIMPDDAHIAFITFGKNVNVHELGYGECAKSYVFRGDPPKNQTLSVERISSLLGMRSKQPETFENRFILPVSEGEFMLTAILEDLGRDRWTVKVGERPARATGVAVAVALGLAEAAMPGSNTRIMLFVGGPPTVGPGKIVGLDQGETIRSHNNMLNGKCPHYQSAAKYYRDLSARGLKVKSGSFVIDIFACSLDQVGISEMKVLVEQSGGYLVLSDSFSTDQFQESFKTIFQRDPDDESDLEMGFNGTLQVVTSREFRVAGAIGSCSSLEKMSPCVAESEIGIGKTSVWRLGGIDPRSTFTLYFEIVNAQAKQLASGRCAYLQLITRYEKGGGTTNLRVTTIQIPFADCATAEGLGKIKLSFDQEAACVVMAKWATFRAENEFLPNVVRWMDQLLVKLVTKFGDYQKNNADSFQLIEEFSYFPQFIFYLRRSQFMNVFNSSPDETAYYRLMLNREAVQNALTMIQPSLLSYTLEQPHATPAVLDVTSRSPDRILLLDTFFHVVLWYGENIAQWRDQNLQENPEYEYFGDLLNAAQEDMENVVINRMPRPTEVVTDQGQGQSRFLNAKLNPSVNHNQVGYDEGGAPPVFTDDVSLRMFLTHLRNLAVVENG